MHKQTYAEETIQIAEQRARETAEQLVAEVKRLLKSGALDPDSHSRGLLFGVALENIADNYLRGERKSNDYRNLKCF